MRLNGSPPFIPKRFLIFLTRGEHFILLGGHLFLRQSGVFSKWLAKPTWDIGPEFAVFSRLKLRPRQNTHRVPESAILISGFGRFGNMVIQVWNSVLAAKSLGTDVVLYWNNPHLTAPEIELIPGVYLKRANSVKAIRSVAPTHLIRTRAFSVARVPEGLSYQEIESLRQSLSAEIFPQAFDSPRFSKDVLVIHLRSGDIFWNEPHRDYGQPPFAFYELAISSQKWDKIILVAEDEKNPCFDLIVRLCSRLNLEIQVTGRTLSEAMDAIANASTLVMSRGTFVASILWLVPAPRHIFIFGLDDLPPFPLASTAVTPVVDAEGSYQSRLLSGNWKNSQEQLDLMTSYPVTCLEILDKTTPD